MPPEPGSDRTSNDDANPGSESTKKFNDVECSAPLKCHDRQANDIWSVLLDQPLDGFACALLNQYEIRCRGFVMWIEISGKGREGTVGHPDHYRRHMFKRIRH